MSLRDLFKRRPNLLQSSSRLDGLVMTVAGYVGRVLADDPGAEFRPATLSKVLNESELAILAAFYVLEKKGIAEPHYGLYCSANAVPIEVYKSIDQVPEEAPADMRRGTFSR